MVEEKKEEIKSTLEIVQEKEVDLDICLIDEKFIRKDEKDLIKFSKNGIINFFNCFEDENLVPWTFLYNKNNLVLHYRKGVLNKFILESS